MAQPSINGIAKSFVYPGNGTVGPIPVGQFLLIQGTSGESPHNSDLAIPGDMGSYTGFYPRDPTLAQRGVSAAWPGATGVQGEGNKMGFIINSGSLLTSNASTPFPLVASYNFVDPYTMDASSAPAPWSSNPNGGLIFTIDLQLPTAVVTGESQVYAYGYFLLRDAATSQDFWLGASHYDHRGLAMASEYVGLDDWVGGTGQAIVNSLVSAPGQYLNDFTTSIQGSSGFQTSTWSGYKRMAWGVTGKNLINAVKSINFKRDHRYKNFSTDPANYRLIHTNFNPEVYYGGGKGFGMIALSFKNLKVLQAASILLPFYRLYNSKLDRHFYTTSVFEAQLKVTFSKGQLDSSIQKHWLDHLFHSIVCIDHLTTIIYTRHPSWNKKPASKFLPIRITCFFSMVIVPRFCLPHRILTFFMASLAMFPTLFLALSCSIGPTPSNMDIFTH